MNDITVFGASLGLILKYFLLIYVCAVSVLSSIVCIKDKISAKKRGKRVSESGLLLTASLGGALFMFLTMLAIRHKTRHVKFMLGLPCIILLHAAVIYLVLI